MYIEFMEKDNHNQFPGDTAPEQSVMEPADLPFVPKQRPPLTTEEIEAGEELCRILGIDLNAISEEVYEELRKIWA